MELSSLPSSSLAPFINSMRRRRDEEHARRAFSVDTAKELDCRQAKREASGDDHERQRGVVGLRLREKLWIFKPTSSRWQKKIAHS